MSTPVLVAFSVALVAAGLLARIARDVGWIDHREGENVHRKPRESPVPPVGGAAIVLALAAAALCGPVDLPWVALLAAFVLGTVDDVRRGGLGPGTKLAGQVVVAGILGAELAGDPARVLAAAFAPVAMNVANTYDNADGALTGLGGVALWGTPAGAALLGFLPWNLLVRRGPERAPAAYLGDAGSHVIGVLLVVTPGAWVYLALPLADLLRLCFVRVYRGRSPWSGDRLHLAHRLEAAGRGPLTVALLLTAVVALQRAAATQGGNGPGVLMGVLCFLYLWQCTPDPSDAPASP